MKKIILTLSLLLLTVSVINAQNDEIFGNNENASDLQKTGYMQTAGSHSFEVSFNPGNVFATGGNAFSLINGTIKYRSFSTEQKAFRIGINANYSNTTEIIQQENDDFDLKELKSNFSVYGITLMPGTEKHFDVSDRISPYVGFQALLGYKHTSYIEEYQDGNSIETESYINDSTNGAGNGYFSLGAGVFTGVDYYFVKRFYVGVELGIGLEYFSYLNSTYTDSGDSDNDEEIKNGTSFQLAPGLTTGNIRLGWTF